MITIKIEDVEYSNVSSVSPQVVYDVVYDVKTMDGRRHRKVKGTRTNYDVVFFNDDFDKYDELKQMLLVSNEVYLEISDGKDTFVSGTFLSNVKGDVPKGILNNGVFYHTALAVTFEKVGYDIDAE